MIKRTAVPQKRKILIFDTHNLGHRSLHVHDPNRDPEHSSDKVLHGIFTQILPRVREFQPTDIVFAFDSITNVRTQQYPQYKQGRIALPFPELRECYDIIKETQLGTPLHATCYEADDIIALIALKYASNTTHVQIVSGDKDLFQLLRPTITQYSPNTKKVHTDRWFMKTYGIHPKQWAMVKAIAGCNSDNVPGILGVGEKTAIKYIKNQLPTTHKCYSHIHKNPYQIQQNMKLVRLPHKTIQPINIFPVTPSLRKFVKMCHRKKFKQIIRNIHIWEDNFHMV